MLRLWGLALALILAKDALSAREHPLHLAWRLAEERYAEWLYGAKADSQQVNCVQFLEDVLERVLQRPLHQWERRKILIQNIKQKENLQKLVQRGDKRTRGIQHALLSMKRGKVVSPKDARAGDFVQYWYKKDSLWVGHAALIQEVRREENFFCSFLYGAHESLNGVGVAGFPVTLNDPHMKVYIVRFQ